MKHSLQLKLLYSFMLIIIVMIIGVSLGVSLLIKEQMLANKQQELIVKGSELARVVGSYQQEDINLEQLTDFLSNADKFLETRVWVVNGSRQVIAMSTPHWRMRGRMAGPAGLGPFSGNMGNNGPMMQAGGMRAILNQLDSVFAGKVWSRTIENPYYGEKMLVVAVPIQVSNGSVSGAVLLHAPVTGINSFMQRIYYYIGAAGLAAVILALLVVSWFTRNIVRPLKAMQQTAVAMARGDYSTLIKVETSDEVGHLGLALNSLSQDLSRYITELEHMEKLRRDFVANVSHELRAPLTVIRGYHEALMDGTAGDPQLTQKYHQFMQSELARLEHLIRDLLDLSRLQSGKVDIDKEDIPLSALANSVINILKQQAEQKQIVIHANTAELPPPIVGNGDRITQLLLILLDNALKYTPPGGTIAVTTSKEDDAVVLRVSDTGIGIPASDLPYIWERFYKVDKSRCRTDDGTGLGLAIAKQIIDLHHAKAEVTSILCQGTTFTIRFPLAAAKGD